MAWEVRKAGHTALHSGAGGRVPLPHPAKEISCAKIPEYYPATWPEPEVQPQRERGTPSRSDLFTAPAQTST